MECRKSCRYFRGVSAMVVGGSGSRAGSGLTSHAPTEGNSARLMWLYGYVIHVLPDEVGKQKTGATITRLFLTWVRELR